MYVEYQAELLNKKAGCQIMETGKGIIWKFLKDMESERAECFLNRF